jgi:hypothetical protein
MRMNWIQVGTKKQFGCVGINVAQRKSKGSSRLALWYPIDNGLMHFFYESYKVFEPHPLPTEFFFLSLSFIRYWWVFLEIGC